MSANPALHPGADIASCAVTASALRDVARRLTDLDPDAACAASALAEALHDFTDAMRDARAGAFRAEQAAARAGLSWRGRAVVASEEEAVDGAEFADVRSLVGCVLSARSRAHAQLLGSCQQVAAALRCT